MRKIIIIFLATIFSFFCRSQTDTVIKKDSSKFILNPFYYYSFKDIKNNNYILPSNYTFDLKKMSSPFDLYHDSIYIREVFYNTYFPTDNKMLFIYNKHYYYFSDPLKPYSGDLGGALVFGALNYLMLLFDK